MYFEKVKLKRLSSDIRDNKEIAESFAAVSSKTRGTN